MRDTKESVDAVGLVVAVGQEDVPGAESTVEAPKPEVVPEVKETYVTTGSFYKSLFVVSILTSILSIFVYDRFFVMKIASFDIVKRTQETRKDLAERVSKGQMTIEQASILAMQDTDQVQTFLEKMPKNLLVISSEVVLSAPKRLTVFGDLYTPLEARGANVQDIKR